MKFFIHNKWEEEGMNCQTIHRRDIISRYLAGELPPAEVVAFETHCLHCAACYQALTQEDKIASFFKSANGLIRLGSQMPTPRPFVVRHVVAMAAVVMVLGAVTFLIWHAVAKHRTLARYQELAKFEAPAYFAAISRNAAGESQFLGHFQKGMASYQKAEYAAAADDLKKAIELEPHNPQVLFFLGVTLLLDGKPEEAVLRLEKITSLPANAYTEEAHWYLGKAYLRMGKIAEARRQFHVVAQLKQQFSARARDIIKDLD